MDLKHPRWIHVLPNGDVLVAEALMPSVSVNNIFDYAMYATMRQAAAVGTSPNRITLLRDPDRDGVAEVRHRFMEGLSQPFGMALVDGTFYVGNTDGVVAYLYREGVDSLPTREGRRLTTFKTAGHWTRSLLASPDGRKLYVGVGSLSNIAESGFEAEVGRACIYELDLASGTNRIFASGLRNPVGLAWEPSTAALWTVVIGDETPPNQTSRLSQATHIACMAGGTSRLLKNSFMPGSVQPLIPFCSPFVDARRGASKPFSATC